MKNEVPSFESHWKRREGIEKDDNQLRLGSELTNVKKRAVSRTYGKVYYLKARTKVPPIELSTSPRVSYSSYRAAPFFTARPINVRQRRNGAFPPRLCARKSPK